MLKLPVSSVARTGPAWAVHVLAAGLLHINGVHHTDRRNVSEHLFSEICTESLP